jgi:hypothetical protein
MIELLGAETLDTRVQVVAIVASSLLFVFILELLRRRHLGEPYAILWLIASVVLLVLAIWNDLLDTIADALGVAVPANMLFAVAFGFVLVLLLMFSVVLSRLSRESRILAQEVARLNRELSARDAEEAARERKEAPISE